jgi:hypothetical protein
MITDLREKISPRNEGRYGCIYEFLFKIFYFIPEDNILTKKQRAVYRKWDPATFAFEAFTDDKLLWLYTWVIRRHFTQM